jgi:O-antigen/teichoic acid export membrane protein
MRAFVKAGARLSFPKYAEQQIDSIRKPLWDKLLRFGTLILLGSIVYALLAPYAYTYLFPAYAASIPYSQAIAFSLVFALGFIPLSALQAHAKTKELYAHSIITNIVQIGTTVTLIGLFGLWGAVCALLINRAVGFFLPLFLLYVTKQKAV